MRPQVLFLGSIWIHYTGNSFCSRTGRERFSLAINVIRLIFSTVLESSVGNKQEVRLLGWSPRRREGDRNSKTHHSFYIRPDTNYVVQNMRNLEEPRLNESPLNVPRNLMYHFLYKHRYVSSIAGDHLQQQLHATSNPNEHQTSTTPVYIILKKC